MKFLGVLLAMVFLSSALTKAAAETSNEELSEQELMVQEAARKRLYPGGRDEDDLKITKSATFAQRKLNKREIEKEVYKELFNEDLKETNGESSDDFDDEGLED